MTQQAPTLSTQGDYLCGRFFAMASPCEILFDCTDTGRIKPFFLQAVKETQRIEAKYSRYQSNSLLHRINNSEGKALQIDDETAQLLQFADTCYEVSDGKFDITSGILRKAWKFDGSANIPSKQQVDALLPYIGWHNVGYSDTEIILPTGFELDLGGIGKEYAVNRAAQILQAGLPELSVLVNFGGDIQITRPRRQAAYWQIGIENPSNKKGVAVVNIAKGGLATSGDANRFLLKDGKRYSHILDPHTGYPIENAARSVTVASEHCIQAGLLATLALLQGEHAETFLKEQDLSYWCYR